VTASPPPAQAMDRIAALFPIPAARAAIGTSRWSRPPTALPPAIATEPGSAFIAANRSERLFHGLSGATTMTP
jgi:hypothetical protein